MINLKVIAALTVALAPLVASVFEPSATRVGTTYQPRVVESAAIAVDPPGSITEHAGFARLPLITITARSFVRHTSNQICNFDDRALTQGRGTVRGFCVAR